AGGAGALALVAFVRRQSRLDRTTGDALLSMRPLAVPTYRTGLAIQLMIMGCMLGTIVVLPLYLQTGRGLTPFEAGLVLVPGGVLQGLGSPLFGRLYDRFGPRPVIVPGALTAALGQWLLATSGPQTELAFVVASHMTFALGMSMLMTPLMTTSLSALPKDLYAHGTVIANTMQQVCGALGTGLMVTVATLGIAASSGGREPSAPDLATGVPWAFTVAAAITSAAAIFAIVFLRPRPSSSEQIGRGSPAPTCRDRATEGRG
ncbi:MAG TPA: MFS transporter, partial [Microbacterium sp.]|nr:MFS transporter [Microbacterium sp.]